MDELGVEQLTIGFCFCDYLYKNPETFFSTDFLPEESCVTRLLLRGGSFLTPKKNALRVVELDYVEFTSEAVQSMLSNCPCLQSLKLISCTLPAQLLIHGPHLELKSLMIFKCQDLKEIDLSASNLIKFEIHNRGALKLSFSRVPSLRTLVIRFFYGTQVVPYVFGNVAQDLPHLESMVFNTDASVFEGCKLDQVVSNLRHLVLVLEGGCNKIDMLELAVLLDSCPLLHKFQLSMANTGTFDQERARDKVVRRDTRLKEVEFNGFKQTECQYNFILHILKSVVSLERVVLTEQMFVYDVYFRRWMFGNAKRRSQIIRDRFYGQSISENVEIIIS